MESLEDFDLVKALNFSSQCEFLELIEEELAGLVLTATQVETIQGASLGIYRMMFPPLKPRYSTLLQATVARFGLKAELRGWGDERCLLVEALLGKVALPVIECADFRIGGRVQRLVDRVRHAPVRDELVGSPTEEAIAQGNATSDESSSVVFVAPTVCKQRSRAEMRGAMRGWSDDEVEGRNDENLDKQSREGEVEDWIAKRRLASAEAGRNVRGRGFTSNDNDKEAAERCNTLVHTCALQKDYSKYVIDPDDTWRPHRKPYVEVVKDWEFSAAWSFDPDDSEQREAARHEKSEVAPRGVLVWKVEHDKSGPFSVAFADMRPNDARRWLMVGGGAAPGKGEEPFVLEFRPYVRRKVWEYRFGRASKRSGWKNLPWSNNHRTTFWVACLPGGANDRRQHLLAGLDEFPERRFFFAKMLLKPRIVGFGPPAENSSIVGGFYIRDIAVFGRASLLPPPFSSRDHFVQLTDLSREASLKLLEDAALTDKVIRVQSLGSDNSSLLVCYSSEDAACVAAKLMHAVPVLSSQWSWPPPNLCEAKGPEASQAHRDATRESWSKLKESTLRVLAIFEEHTHRRTRHLEGFRLARTAATRMVLNNLGGDAPPPQPPHVGV